MGQIEPEVGEYAEQAFSECLKLWFGGDKFGLGPMITSDDPDIHGIDKRCEIKSRSNPLHDTKLHFQVKSKIKYDGTESRLYREQCVVVRVEREQLRKLYDNPEPSFLVVGIPAVSVSDTIRRFLDMPPHKRFKWYAINAKQFLRSCWEHKKNTDFPSSVHIPIRNQLNASMASLLWAGWWAYSQTRNIYSESVISHPKLYSNFLNPLIFKRNISTASNDLLIKASSAYNRCIVDVPADIRTALSHLSGAAFSMAKIAAKTRGKGALKHYFVAVTEAGREEIAFWLFCRWYRDYVVYWREDKTIEKGGRYERVFPMHWPAVADMPHHLRLAHYYAIISHMRLGATAYIEQLSRPSSDIDITLVDKLGVVETHLLNQSEMWKVNIKGTKGQQRELYDMFHQRRQTATKDDAQSFCMTQLTSGFGTSDLDFVLGQPPIDLLPPECPSIQHPTELWETRFCQGI